MAHTHTYTYVRVRIRPRGRAPGQPVKAPLDARETEIYQETVGGAEGRIARRITETKRTRGEKVSLSLDGERERERPWY